MIISGRKEATRNYNFLKAHMKDKESNISNNFPSNMCKLTLNILKEKFSPRHVDRGYERSMPRDSVSDITRHVQQRHKERGTSTNRNRIIHRFDNDIWQPHSRFDRNLEIYNQQIEFRLWQ